MKISDAKFVQRSIERFRQASAPRAFEAPASEDLSRLRNTFSKFEREARMLMPDAEGDYEPVSFQHPDSGRRVYGWLVAVEPSGSARVAFGDGEYAVVPPEELKRLGAKEDRSKIKAELRRAIGQVSSVSGGVRADLSATGDIMPVDAESNAALLTLSYSAAYGIPTPEEVGAFIQRAHPDAEVIDADVSLPGRVGVALRMGVRDIEAEMTLDAEMDGAAGGEVIETLDPEAAIESDADIEKTAIFGLGNNGDKQQLKNTTPQDAAKALIASSNEKLIESALREYFDAGGGKALARANKPFNTELLLQAAMPVIQRRNPRLWKEVVAQTTSGQVGELPKPASPDLQKAMQTQKVQDLANQEFDDEGTSQGAQGANAPSNSAPVSPGQVAPGSGTRQVGPGSGTPASAGSPGAPITSGQAQQQATPPTAPGTPTTQQSGGNMLNEKEQAISDTMKKQKYPQRVIDQMVDHIRKTEPMAQEAMTKAYGTDDGMRQASKRASIFEPKQAAKKTESKPQKPEAYGLAPSTYDLHKSMKMHRMARLGDYIVAKVEWDPKLMKDRHASACKQAVISFVKSQAGSGEGRASFGPMGAVHVLDFDQKKGSARVKFATMFAGSVPLGMVEIDDD